MLFRNFSCCTFSKVSRKKWNVLRIRMNVDIFAPSEKNNYIFGWIINDPNGNKDGFSALKPNRNNWILFRFVLVSKLKIFYAARKRERTCKKKNVMNKFIVFWTLISCYKWIKYIFRDGMCIYIFVITSIFIILRAFVFCFALITAAFICNPYIVSVQTVQCACYSFRCSHLIKCTDSQSTMVYIIILRPK